MFPGLKLPHVHLVPARDDRHIIKAVIAEFTGLFFLQLAAPTLTKAALPTSLAFAAAMYFTQHLSGGHLNPSVTLAATISGHVDRFRCIYYLLGQILGAIMGALVMVGLTPGAKVGKEWSGVCFEPPTIGSGRVFGWELAMSLLFISVMYAGVFAPPGHGAAAPLAAAIALFTGISAAGPFTDFSPLNPARLVASMAVFHCSRPGGWRLLFAELTASVLASIIAVGNYGRGVHMGGPRPENYFYHPANSPLLPSALPSHAYGGVKNDRHHRHNQQHGAPFIRDGQLPYSSGVAITEPLIYGTSATDEPLSSTAGVGPSSGVGTGEVEGRTAYVA